MGEGDNTKNPTKIIVRSTKTSGGLYTRVDFMRDLKKVSEKSSDEKPVAR